MLSQEQVVAKREELRVLQQKQMEQARKNEEQQQFLARQQNNLVLQLQGLQGQIDALTLVLMGEESPNGVVKEEEAHAPS